MNTACRNTCFITFSLADSFLLPYQLSNTPLSETKPYGIWPLSILHVKWNTGQQRGLLPHHKCFCRSFLQSISKACQGDKQESHAAFLDPVSVGIGMLWGDFKIFFSSLLCNLSNDCYCLQPPRVVPERARRWSTPQLINCWWDGEHKNKERDARRTGESLCIRECMAYGNQGTLWGVTVLCKLGGAGFSFAAVGALLWLQRPQTCPRRWREGSKHYSRRATPIKAASCSPFPHLFLPPCTGHSILQLHQPCELQQLTRWGKRWPILLQTQQGRKQVFLQAVLHLAQPKPCLLLLLQPLWILKFGSFGFEIKWRKCWELRTIKQLPGERMGTATASNLPPSSHSLDKPFRGSFVPEHLW